MTGDIERQPFVHRRNLIFTTPTDYLGKVRCRFLHLGAHEGRQHIQTVRPIRLAGCSPSLTCDPYEVKQAFRARACVRVIQIATRYRTMHLV